MAELTDEQKHEIVELLACYRTTAAIIAHFQEVHGFEMNHKQVGIYDPTRRYFAAGDKWREIFDERRKAYLESVSTVPIANQGYRLNVLNELLVKALANDKPGLAITLLEQAAKEVGGIMTNQREVRVDDNRRMKAIDMTPEDRRAAMAEIIRQAIEKRAEQGLSIEKSSGVQQSARGLTVAACAQ